MSSHQTISGTFTAAKQLSAGAFYLRNGETASVTLTMTGDAQVSLVSIVGSPPTAYVPLQVFTSSQSSYPFINDTGGDLYLALSCDAVGGGVTYTLADVAGDQILQEWRAADGTLVTRITDQGLFGLTFPLPGQSSGVINVKDPQFGALGDGVEVLDAGMTSGSATLTSATAGFTSRMVGQAIQVVGAGTAGASLTTTIAAFISSSSVTLAASAATTVTDARAVWGSDDTAAFQAAFDAAEAVGGGTVITPRGMYLVDPLQPKSNTTWVLDAGTTIYANAGFVDGGFAAGASDCLVELYDVENVVIDGYGARFAMRVWDYTSGEFRHCFDLRGTTNVTIKGVSAERSGGDGFCIQKSFPSGLNWCENTRLIDVTADANRRQGISVISVKKCWIEHPILINTVGTAPQAGLDIEPNASAAEECEDVWVVDAQIEGNTGQGILVALFNWMESITSDKYVSINIVRPNIVGSSSGIAVVGGDLSAGVTLTGHINIDGAVTQDARLFGIGVQDWPSASIPVRIVDCTVVRPNADGGAGSLFGSAFAVYRESGSARTQVIGNVAIIRPSVIDDRDTPLVRRLLTAQDGQVGNANLSRVLLENPAIATGPTLGPSIVFAGSGSIADPFGVMTTVLSADANTTVTSFSPLTTNGGASGTITSTLSVNIPPNAPLLTFRVDAAHEYRIDADATSTIRFGGATAGQYIYSSTVGSTVTLRRSSTTSWDVVAMTGQWFVQGATAYSPTNVTTDRAFDADTVAVAELADVVGTLIADLKARQVIP